MSDLTRVDSHEVKASEYEDLPGLSDAMLQRGSVKRAERPVTANPRR